MAGPDRQMVQFVKAAQYELIHFPVRGGPDRTTIQFVMATHYKLTHLPVLESEQLIFPPAGRHQRARGKFDQR